MTTRQLTKYEPSFSPRHLFSRMQGVWAEPSPVYCFQDTTGTTPCTADTTAALLLDKSRGLLSKPELVTNGSFSTSTGWNLGTNWSIGGGTLNAANATSACALAVATTLGRFYVVTFTVSNYVSGQVRFQTDGVASTFRAANGTYTFIFSQTSAAQVNIIIYGSAFTGSVDNLSVTELLGNHALQATAANRPTLSARYNLLTYSEDFSNGVWNKIRSSYLNGVLTQAAGQTNAGAVQSQPLTLISTFTYRLSAEVKKDGKTWCRLGETIFSSTVANTWFNLQAGVVGTINSNHTNPTITTIDSGYYRISVDVRYNNAISSATALVYLADEDNSLAVTSSGGIYIRRADLRPANLPANIPTYQRIAAANDYDTIGFPWYLRHDATDYLTAMLPSINVRRNLLTYSEQFDNAAWFKTRSVVIPNVILAPNDTSTASLFIEDTSSNNTHYLYRNYISTGSGGIRTGSYYVKMAGRRYVSLVAFNSTDGDRGRTYFDLQNGAVVSGPGTIVPLKNGWYRCSITVSYTAPDRIDLRLSATGISESYSGDGISGVYIWAAQLEDGLVATTYQRITDWTSEAYSSSGSVYFGTPVGLSAFHNQSMGTTYNLPAPNTDVYGYVIVPERLTPVEEAKLERYFNMKIGLPEPSYFVQEDYGPELVTNGDFSNGTTGWSIGINCSVVDGNGVFSSTSNLVGFVQAAILVVGKYYAITYTVSSISAGRIQVGAGTGSLTAGLSTTGTETKVLQCISNTSLYIVALGTTTATIDNISVRELKDGISGYLTADNGTDILLMQ